MRVDHDTVRTRVAVDVIEVAAVMVGLVEVDRHPTTAMTWRKRGVGLPVTRARMCYNTYIP